LALNGILGNLYLALVAGFLATVIGIVIRNTIMVRDSGAPDDARIPMVVIVFSIVASLAGSSTVWRLCSIVMIKCRLRFGSEPWLA
jgi:hypothetical protein